MKQNQYKFIVAGIGSNGRPVAYFTNDKPYGYYKLKYPEAKFRWFWELN